MFDRLKSAWNELWDDSDIATRYTVARHAAEARLAQEPKPLPDQELVNRILAREKALRVGVEKRLRVAGY